MSRLMSLHKDPRTGIYYFRKVIPEGLRPFFGRREFKESLRTRNPMEARALLPSHSAEYERQAQAARTAIETGDSGLATQLVGKWLRATERDDDWHLMATARLAAWYRASQHHDLSSVNPAFAFEDALPFPDEPANLRTVISRYRSAPWPPRHEVVAALPLHWFQWVVDQVVEHTHTPQLTDTMTMRCEIAEDIRRRLVTTEVNRLRRRNGQHATQPASSVIIVRTEAQTTMQSNPANSNRVGLKLSEAFNAWKAAYEQKGRKLQLIQEWDLAVRRFTALYGDVDMGEITAKMVRDWRELLLQLPSRPKFAIRAMPLEEQAALAASDGLDTLSPATVNKALTAIRSITEHVVEKMRDIPLESNVATLAKFVSLEDDETKRLPFDEHDLATIFGDLEIHDTTGISRETIAWIIFLAAFTGCRLEELGTLRPFNVRREQGILYIAIERDPAHIRNEVGEEKGVKTASAERDIPVHPIILRAGFEEFVQRRRREGAVWLFPDLKPNKFGKRTARVSRLFARMLEDRGIIAEEKVFHSFRHSVRRNLRGRASEEIVDLICGHSDGKTGRRYGRGADMRPLNEVIRIIDHAGPDWTAVISQCRRMSGLSPEPGYQLVLGPAGDLTHRPVIR